MKRRPTFLGVFIIFLVIVAIAHMSLHLAFYGTGYSGFAEKGITGLAVEGSETESGGLPISEIILFLEWGLIFLGMIFVYAKHKIDLKKEFTYLDLLKKKKHFHGGTELDNFYELLKEMKHFRLANAAKAFQVDIEVIEDWAQSLETAQVAELTYPRIGGPEIQIIEKTKPEEKAKKEDKQKQEKKAGEKEKTEKKEEAKISKKKR